VDLEELRQRIEELAARHRQLSARLAERANLRLAADHPDFEDARPAFSLLTKPVRGAILQPPKPQIYPSGRILRPAADRDLDWEAAD
jgi:hypothetical protein